jgi:hypothetical protein
MLKTRNRIINFRVTESEFEQLMTASMENGASCMSDYVRTAMMRVLEDGYYNALGNGNGKDEIQVLMQRLGLVERSIAKLESMVSQLCTGKRKEMSVGAPA